MQPGSRGRLGRRGWGLPLTVYVVPGQVLEGLIEQDDRQRYLEHHHPLVPAQGGDLENELVGGGLVKERTAWCSCFTHPGYNGLLMNISKTPLEVLPLELCPPHFLCLKCPPRP